MKFNYLYYLPEKFRATATQLFFNALKEKLEPILSSDGRAQEVIASNLPTDKCLVAFCDDKLVGTMGIQTKNGEFVNPSLKTMIRIFGILGCIFCMIGLVILKHTTTADKLYVDGVTVAHEMKGKGIGSHMFGLLERTASQKGFRTISLEVIETNTRAKALYEHLGFVVMKTRTLWPSNLFLIFPFRSATFMIKMIG
jgi:ribosomal protein S18 acetylase RimI-like enzyme